MSRSAATPGKNADLLVELGCEELPPKSLDTLREAFYKGISDGLEKHNVPFDASASRSFSTPRRLAAVFGGVAAGQADQVQERRGPALSAAFDADGEPTAAARGFARSLGMEVEALQRVESDNGAWLHATVHLPGQTLDDLIFPILEQAIRQLPVPRPMRWSDKDYSFVRPVHWLVVMHGPRVIEGRLLGKSSGRQTRGHRIHAPGPYDLSSSGAYAEVLADAYVVADPQERRARIREALLQAEPDVLIEPALLDEVNNLVEWPVAVSCRFEEIFLKVPHAALIASMQDHQKFFPVADPSTPGQVSNRFVAIANLESQNVSAVREGYERVIRPRLADARFFLEQDQKHPLDSHLPALDRIIFQRDIGSVGDKSKRMSAISKKLAEHLSSDPGLCARAALLAKCDLLTQMVGEFPELQGVMGEHYARFSDEPPEVAVAIGEHYAPAFAGDAIPSSDAGRIVSIADRADSLVGIFAAGLRPTGNKDPFALRRAALGLVRILLEARLDLPLNRILALAANELSGQVAIEPTLLVEVRDFVVERLRHYYRERGFATELVQAALASDWDTLPDLEQRLTAINGFMGQEAAASLAAANKRIGNILKKADEGFSQEIDPNRLILAEEKLLFAEVNSLEKELGPLLAKRDYATSLQLLSRLREPVDAFFDAVMVMDEDRALRSNRLALLDRLKALFDRIADLSILG
jgi:glycyl-tRNA synthetase beta chain